MTTSPTIDRSASRNSCGLAFACFLFAVMLGMFGMGRGFAILLMLGAVVFALLAGILYVFRK